MPSLWRKRPVIIEAQQWLPNGTGSPETEEMREWLNKHGAQWSTEGIGKNCIIQIDTLEGLMTAGPGWWIIKGVQGEFYPCRADVFAESYEAV